MKVLVVGEVGGLVTPPPPKDPENEDLAAGFVDDISMYELCSSTLQIKNT